MSNNRKVWFITGVSRGLGKVLAQEALKQGDFVIGTTRDGKSDITAPVGSFHVLAMDVTDRMQVAAAVKAAYAIHWRIDIVVNNAGYGLLGAIEEISQAEAKDQFETNFFGALNVIQSTLSILRTQNDGHIINISSVAGIVGFESCGLYTASKFALEGLSESLAREVAPFNIRVTIVEPGVFKTEFLSQQSIKISAPSDDYPEMQKAIDYWSNMDGAQTGDPVKAAQAIIKIAHDDAPPLRLVLGQDAYGRIKSKIAVLTDELERYEEVSTSTNFVGV